MHEADAVPGFTTLQCVTCGVRLTLTTADPFRRLAMDAFRERHDADEGHEIVEDQPVVRVDPQPTLQHVEVSARPL